METWFKLNYYYWPSEDYIQKIKVEKSTEKTITINGTRNNTRTDYYNYFRTFQEAKDFAIQREDVKIARLKEQLSRAEENKEKVLRKIAELEVK